MVDISRETYNKKNIETITHSHGRLWLNIKNI